MQSMEIFTVMECDEFQAQKSGSEMPPSCRTRNMSSANDRKSRRQRETLQASYA
jgi:hypothetical protein